MLATVFDSNRKSYVKFEKNSQTLRQIFAHTEQSTELTYTEGPINYKHS